MDYKIPDKLKYTMTHEWILKEDNEGLIGITDYAQDQLGDIVYIEFPSIGDKFDIGEAIAEIESIKAVEEFLIPISGEVIAVNDGVNDKPEVVNEDPYQEGWLARIKITNIKELEELLSAEDYRNKIEELTSE